MTLKRAQLEIDNRLNAMTALWKLFFPWVKAVSLKAHFSTGFQMKDDMDIIFQLMPCKLLLVKYSPAPEKSGIFPKTC